MTMLAAAAILVGPPAPVRADTNPPSTPPTASPVTVQVSPTPVGRPVPPGFIGMSFEFSAVRDYTGPDPAAINPVLVQLIRNLVPRQSPVLRIGGNSVDETWWPLPHVPRSPGIKYTLTRSWMATTRALAAETGGKLILGLNLKLNSAAEIAAEAAEYRQAIGARYIDAFEIGNEPELYPITPYYYRGPSKVPVYPRPRSFTFAAYASEIAGFAKQLGATTFAGPATGNFAWLKHVPKLFGVQPGLKMITYHRYPLIKCFTQPGDPNYPTIPNLLTVAASRNLLQGAAPYIALAHRLGATFRVDELNSVACKGKEGVSDTFASALWMLDTLFAMARSGVDGVNIHTLPEAVYKPFTFDRVGGRWVATVRPEYYGLLMFAQAVPPGSRLLTVSPSVAAGAEVRARAVVTPTGVIHVVLINDSLTTDHVVTVRPPASVRTALLERLTAPSAEATDGVTLAGQSFGAQTTTGTLTGSFQGERLTAVQGQYQISLPASSAALVSLAPAPATG
jgi:Glycosyl hydrolase family 79 C-terminal beta domain